jgi:hypothetical protein
MVFVKDPGAPVLTSGDAHHLLDVLRLRTGEVVVASDGAGSWAPCRLAAPPPGRGSRGIDVASLLEPDGRPVTQPRLWPEITVAFAPTKGDRPEWVTQKLTELGVDRVVPIRSARSVVRWDGERGGRAVERLRRVAREAAAQCRRPWLPEIAAVTPLDGIAALVGARPLLGGGLRWTIRSLPSDPKAAGTTTSWPASEPVSAWGRPCCGPKRRRWPPAPCSALCGAEWWDPLHNHAP